jgi:hypothetical protein
MSEKAVFVRASKMDYIIFAIKDFPSDWHTALVCSIFRQRVDRVDHTQADKVALGVRPLLPLRGNLLP